jgi:hypothetical protein
MAITRTSPTIDISLDVVLDCMYFLLFVVRHDTLWFTEYTRAAYRVPETPSFISVLAVLDLRRGNVAVDLRHARGAIPNVANPGQRPTVIFPCKFRSKVIQNLRLRINPST